MSFFFPFVYVGVLFFFFFFPESVNWSVLVVLEGDRGRQWKGEKQGGDSYLPFVLFGFDFLRRGKETVNAGVMSHDISSRHRTPPSLF